MIAQQPAIIFAQAGTGRTVKKDFESQSRIKEKQAGIVRQPVLQIYKIPGQVSRKHFM